MRGNDNAATLSSPAFDQRAAQTLEGNAPVPRLLAITSYKVHGTQFFTTLTVFWFCHDEVIAGSCARFVWGLSALLFVEGSRDSLWRS